MDNQNTTDLQNDKLFSFQTFKEVYRIWRGSPLLRAFNALIAATILLKGGAIANQVMVDGATGAAELTNPEQVDSTRKVIMLILSFLDKTNDSLGTVFLIMAMVCLAAIIFLEFEERRMRREKVDFLKLNDGQVLFYGKKVSELSFFRRIHFWMGVSRRAQLEALGFSDKLDDLLFNFQNLAFLTKESHEDGKDDFKTNINKYINTKILTGVQMGKNRGDARCFLLLGDSGMGKSTTLKKLYQQYIFSKKARNKHVFFIHFSELEEKCLVWEQAGLALKDCVVFVDGMDEDLDVYAVSKPWNKVETKRFFAAIIASRSQIENTIYYRKTPRVYLHGLATAKLRKKYVQRRLPLGSWFNSPKVKQNRKLRKLVLDQIEMINDQKGRPILLDWLVNWAKSAQSDQLDDMRFEYSFQLIDAFIKSWFRRESDILNDRGLAGEEENADYYKKLIHKLAVKLFSVEQNKITDSALLEYWMSNQGPIFSSQKTERDDAIIASKKFKTHSLLRKDSKDYFFFSHRIFWEYLVARSLFDCTNYVEYDKNKLRKYPGIRDFYNQICWAEIVPNVVLPNWKIKEKLAIPIHNAHKLHQPLQLGERSVEIFDKFENPAHRAFLMALDKGEFDELKKTDTAFEVFEKVLAIWQKKCAQNLEFAHLLAASSIKNEVFSNPFLLQKEVVSTNITAQDLATLDFSFFRFKNLDETGFNSESAPNSILDVLEKVKIPVLIFKHKCLLDFFIFNADLHLSVPFLQGYCREPFASFVADKLAEEAYSIKENEANLKVTKLRHLALLFINRSSFPISCLEANNLNLTNPNFLTQFKKLKTLKLNNNNITSIKNLIGPTETPPDERGRRWAGQHLQALEELHLEGNQITLDEETKKALALQPFLRTLNLKDNGLDGFYDASENCLDAFRDEVLTFPDMVEVPAGTFTMGYTDGWLERPEVEQYSEQAKNWIKDREKNAHQVKLKKYKIAKHPVTVAEFRRFQADTEAPRTLAELRNQSMVISASGYVPEQGFDWRYPHKKMMKEVDGELKVKKQEFENMPVLHVSWYDAINFCNWLSKQAKIEPVYYEISEIEGSDPDNENLAADTTHLKELDPRYLVKRNEGSKGFRLPTEAEWEFAARAAQANYPFSFAGSNNLDEVAWCGHNSHDEKGVWHETKDKDGEGFYFSNLISRNNKIHPIKTKLSNELGIFDLSGNVWEWCYDWYKVYDGKEQENPIGADAGISRVLRGGSWDDYSLLCRLSYRDNYQPR